MKAIVANVLFGGTLGCLGWTNSALANPKVVNQPELGITPTSIISAKIFSPEALMEIPQSFGLIDRILTINELEGSHSSLSSENNDYFPSGKKPFIHDSEEIDLILGFQDTFWPSASKQKYWGLTTVEHWGENNHQGLTLPQLNYTNSSPVLAVGSSALTFSGGGNKDLGKQAILDNRDRSQEFEEFRGGITYHRGVASQVTLGVGFIYEDNVAGFTQLTYNSAVLPVKTTFSLLVKESTVDLHSHVRFQPASNFVVNYYNDQEKQKFDLNWGMSSNLSLIAKGNTQTESYSTGINIAVKNNFLALSASAALDNNHNLQWKLNSQIGNFKLAYDSKQEKTSSELSTSLIDSSNWGFKCSAFIKYQTQMVKKEQQDFVVWGSKLNSTEKISANKHYWTIDLGYGSGVHGKGLILNSSVALNPNLSLKLDYQEISAGSDDTKIKLQLSSN